MSPKKSSDQRKREDAFEDLPDKERGFDLEYESEPDQEYIKTDRAKSYGDLVRIDIIWLAKKCWTFNNECELIRQDDNQNLVVDYEGKRGFFKPIRAKNDSTSAKFDNSFLCLPVDHYNPQPVDNSKTSISSKF